MTVGPWDVLSSTGGEHPRSPVTVTAACPPARCLSSPTLRNCLKFLVHLPEMRQVMQASHIPYQRTLRLREGGANLPSEHNQFPGSQGPSLPPSLPICSWPARATPCFLPLQGEGLGGAVTAKRVRTQCVGLIGETPPSARFLWGLGGSLVERVHPSLWLGLWDH